MSTRQTGFFDQQHGNKQRARSNWNRTRSANDAKPADIRQPVMSGPPIAASSQSRTKLKAFQFIEGRPSVADYDTEANKENIEAAPGKERVSKNKEGDVSAAETSAPPIVNVQTCPTTPAPATRLPLADLIGNSDGSTRRAPVQAVSPDEQLVWHIGSQPAVTPAPRKKRARSSSPIPSQTDNNEALGPFPAKDNAYDVERMQQALRTPQANPAAELWNRFGGGAVKDAQTGVKGQAFAHLMSDLSPHSSATAGSVSGLRRWASCGVEWPASKTKRRRTAGAFREGMDNQTESAQNEAGENVQGISKLPRVSRLGSLVERLQETLPRPKDPNAPSSSSPLPETGNPQSSAAPVSPLQRLAPVQEGSDTEPGEPEALLEAHQEGSETDPGETAAPQPDESGGERHAKTNSPTSSSDFGDADIDLDLLEAGTEVNATDALYPIPELPQPEPAEVNPQQPTLPQPALQEPARLSRPAETGSDDEFDFGDDEDIFAEVSFDGSGSVPATGQVSFSSRPLTVETPRDPNAEKEASRSIKIVEDSDDEFGGDDIDEEQLAAAEIAATQAFKASGTTSDPDKSMRTLQRYLVKDVVGGYYQDKSGHSLAEKVLLVQDEKSKASKAITLRQGWVDTRCTPGSYVHVIGEFSATGQCLIDDENNMLILHPDHLISATVVANSFSCIRKSVLEDRIKATSDANEAAMIGSILHEILQEALQANTWDSEWFYSMITKILPKYFETILEIGLAAEHVEQKLMNSVPELQGWARIYVQTRPGPDAIVQDRRDKDVKMSIKKLLDVEEHIWSPTYGLKGNIDASVQVLMQDSTGERNLAVPFEFKTGRKNGHNETYHVAQTALYTLLMSERYDVDIAYGLLFYLGSSEISRVPAIRRELQSMIMQRNEIACYVRERLQLPPMITNSHACGRCYAQESCFLYHKLAEDGMGETLKGPTKDKFKQLVRYLKPAHQEFFQKWDLLLTKEEADMRLLKRELWTLLSHEREKVGRCFANVIVEPGSLVENVDGQKINRFQYTLVKHNAPAGFSFTESQIKGGEAIVISDEKGHFALANGYVTNVRKRRITVAVDRRLHNTRTRNPRFDAQFNQDFAGIMEVAKETNRICAEAATNESDAPILYRLDKDEFDNGMAKVRNNLLQLMNDGDLRATTLRELIVDGKKPAFHPSPSAYCLPSQSEHSPMNPDQKAAIDKVFSAQDYALVLGMPGTGKTTTIAHIIRSLVAKGKSVLLTSYTHTAVDNILLKIRDDGIGILRLGAASKVHPQVQEFATLAAHPQESLDALQRTWNDPPVVATTCLTIDHPIFRRRVFDYCIVDEASQITLPVCLGPIRMAKKFILVGDHYQLPPLVKNEAAKQGGLDVSLFKMLSEQHPEAVVNLEHQYRMCADIMLLSSRLIYNGRLKCGNDAVAARSLTIPHPDALSRHHYKSRNTTKSQPSFQLSAPRTACPSPTSPKCWLSQLLNPTTKVLFLNTDPLLPSSRESFQSGGGRVTNPLEATIVTQSAVALLTSGIPATDIGIITFPNSQLSLLRSSLRTHPGLEIETADRYQGRDKEVVIVSCVRSNDEGNIGELLKDWRRVNVAVTRARSKLVVVGSAKTMRGGESVMRDMVGICEGRGWVWDLPREAGEMHWFEEGGTQTQMDGGSPEGRRVEGLKGKGCKTPSPKKKGRMALGAVAANVVEGRVEKGSPVKNKGLRAPEKVGRMSKKGVLGGRPVLRDIVNDALAGFE